MENIKKAIAFSIYGDNPKYLNGLLRNLKVSNFFYPGWIIYIYYNSSVPIEVINQIKNEKNIQLRDMSNSQLPCIMWRFLVNDELSVNAFIDRDADSRINIREAVAVHEWLNSTRKLHIMRDHPHHNFKILGGMWGLKNSRLNMLELINIYLLKCRSNYKLDSKMIDQDFLKDVIYKKYY